MTYSELIEHFVQRGTLRTPAIIEAFRQVSREDFLPAEVRAFAGEDHPFCIGHGQTNSQPYTVALMLEMLQPGSGQRILDVGCGSGWTTALLAHIVGAGGQVTGTEIIAELAQLAAARCRDENVHIIHTPSGIGCSDQAPYDRILVSAAASRLPDTLLEQLSAEGTLVIPIGHSIYRFEKHAGNITQSEFPGFSFVPLIEGDTNP